MQIRLNITVLAALAFVGLVIAQSLVSPSQKQTKGQNSRAEEPASIQEVFRRQQGLNPIDSMVSKSLDESLEKTRMSVDFADADLSEVLRTISAAYGISVIADKEVTGKVTMHLHEVPILEGLEVLCAANGLEVYREGQIFRIRKASDKTINILKMNLQRIDLDVQNRDVKEFIKEFSEKTGLRILAGSDLNGNVSGSWKNVVPLDGFKALMEAHGFRIKQKNGFLIVSGKEEGPMVRRQKAAGTLEIEVKDGKVFVNLESADLQEVLRAIAEQAHLNIVFYGETKEMINATISGATFDEVFSTLLKGSRFTYVLTPEGTLLVGEKGARSALSTVVMLPLKYLKSENALKLMPKSLTDGGLQITDIKEQNALVLSGAMSEIENAKRFFSLVDVPTLQVALECIIVEYNRGNGFEIGLKNTSGVVVQDANGNLVKNGQGKIRANGYLGLAGVTRSFDSPFGGVDIGLLGDRFELELASLENENKAQVLARPSISTLNGNKASINVTNTTYYKISQVSKDGLPVNDYRPFNDGISLEITPSVTQAGEITIDIAPEIKTSARAGSDERPADVSTRTLRTTVNLKDGQTVRLGGLIRSSVTRTREAIPFLGSIPFLGWLFSYNAESEITTELVLYITPRVIQEGTGQVDFRKEYDSIHDREGLEDVLNVIAP